MKPYGRIKQHPGNTPDNHPNKGHVNWWELENSCVKSKKRARQEAVQAIGDALMAIHMESYLKRVSARLNKDEPRGLMRLSQF